MPDRTEGEERARRPLVEWIAAGLGLVLTLALLGFVGWQALQEPEETAPRIAVRATGITQSGAGYLVEIAAANRTGQTAAGVEVEGELRLAGGGTERSTATFDYVPGHSEARGGLFFQDDPAAGELKIRALGYREP